tara:strand:- start:622 stop:1227 length:606 start_codon:yes stop_codon:yes gene_type:complete
MTEQENPISTHQGTFINPAKEAVKAAGGHWIIPEGTILAGAFTRAMAYMIDTIFVMGVLYLLTSILGGQAASIVQAYNLGLALSGGKATVLFFANWFLIFSGNYLYHKFTGLRYGRSYAQRWLGLAVVLEDGKPLVKSDWDARAIRKMKYAIPVLGAILFGIRDLILIHKRHTHQSSIDLTVGSIVVDGTSLPPALRKHLR